MLARPEPTLMQMLVEMGLASQHQYWVVVFCGLPHDRDVIFAQRICARLPDVPAIGKWPDCRGRKCATYD